MTALRSTFWRVALSLFGLCGLSARAAQAQAPSLDVRVARTNVCLGEPVVLEYTVGNPEAQQARVYLGEEGQAWLNVTLLDASGKKIEPRNYIHVRGKQALQGQSTFVSPDDKQTGALVINRLFSINQPGTYQLQVHPKLAYVFGERAEHLLDKQIEAQADGTLQQDFLFTLTVSAADPERLDTIAKSLTQSLSFHPNGGKTDVLVDSLFALPSKYALRYEKELVAQPGLPQQVWAAIIARVGRYPSREAIDFLAWMAWQAPLPAQVRPTVKRTLLSFYEEGDANVKEQVRLLFVKNEGKLPDLLPSQIGMDL